MREFYPDDARLGVKVGYSIGPGRFTETGYKNESPATFADVLKLLSEKSQVPLDATEPFRDFKVDGRSIPSTELRAEMIGWASHFHGIWEKRGDGYYLISKRAASRNE